MGALTGCGQEHFGRRDHFPAAAVVLSAPKLLESPAVEMLSEIEIALELAGRAFAQRVVWRQKGAELKSCHFHTLRKK